MNANIHDPVKFVVNREQSHIWVNIYDEDGNDVTIFFRELDDILVMTDAIEQQAAKLLRDRKQEGGKEDQSEQIN